MRDLLIIFLCVVVTIILLVVNTCFFVCDQLNGKACRIWNGVQLGCVCVFVPSIFFPPPPTIFITILYIFLRQQNSPHESAMFVYKVLHWSWNSPLSQMGKRNAQSNGKPLFKRVKRWLVIWETAGKPKISQLHLQRTKK